MDRRLSFSSLAKILLLLMLFVGYSKSMINEQASQKSAKSSKSPTSKSKAFWKPGPNKISDYDKEDEAYYQTYKFQLINKMIMATSNILPISPMNLIKNKMLIKYSVYTHT